MGDAPCSISNCARTTSAPPLRVLSHCQVLHHQFAISNCSSLHPTPTQRKFAGATAGPGDSVPVSTSSGPRSCLVSNYISWHSSRNNPARNPHSGNPDSNSTSLFAGGKVVRRFPRQPKLELQHGLVTSEDDQNFKRHTISSKMRSGNPRRANKWQ